MILNIGGVLEMLMVTRGSWACDGTGSLVNTWFPFYQVYSSITTKLNSFRIIRNASQSKLSHTFVEYKKVEGRTNNSHKNSILNIWYLIKSYKIAFIPPYKASHCHQKTKNKKLKEQLKYQLKSTVIEKNQSKIFKS